MSTVTLVKVGDRIHADIPWDNGAGPEDAKAVRGARPKYDGRKFVCWTYPLAITTCRDLREVFGKRLRISAELAEWARKAIAAEATQIKLRSADTADLMRVGHYAPVLAEAMNNRPFQKVGASFIANGRTVLIADEPGLGKTLETLAGIVEAGAKRVLVFAKKKAAETVWGAEVPRWLGDKAEVYVATGDLTKVQRDKVLNRFLVDQYENGREQPDRIRIVVCNIEMCRQKKGEAPKFPQLFPGDGWDAIVVDESHKALIGKNVMSNNITQQRYGMMQLPLKPGGLKVALSGTPFRGKSQNAWGTLNWLRPDVFTSYWRWVAEYFEVSNGYGGSRIIEGIAPEREAAYDRMMAPYLLRRTKAEVAQDMPPRMYGGTPLDPDDPHSTIGVWLDMEPAQAKHYADIVAHGETRLASGVLTANGHLAELTRMKQFASCSWDIVDDGPGEAKLEPRQPSNKYNWLLEFIQEREAAGLKVVVASQYTKLLNAFSCWLTADGVRSYTLTGETRERDVAAIVAAFNEPSDPVPAVLINTMAGGESINLDACADDVVFIDETFIPDDQEQVENRIHRMSRIHQVNVWYLRSRGTVDEDICKITGVREGAVKSRLDGSRGVQILRRIMEQ